MVGPDRTADRDPGPGGIVYREAVADDAAPLAEFARATFVATFGHLYPPADLAGFLAGKYGADRQRAEIEERANRLLLALEHGAIVGYCLSGELRLPVEGPGLELQRLYVAEHVRGRGVAAALIEDAIAWARSRGAPALYLSVWENNERAQRFYRRYGFEHVGEHGFMVGSVRDRDLIWRLDLARLSG